MTIIKDVCTLTGNPRIVIDSKKNLYFCGFDNKIYKVTQEGEMSLLAKGFSVVSSCMDIYDDQIYVSDGFSFSTTAK